MLGSINHRKRRELVGGMCSTRHGEVYDGEFIHVRIAENENENNLENNAIAAVGIKYATNQMLEIIIP